MHEAKADVVTRLVDIPESAVGNNVLFATATVSDVADDDSVTTTILEPTRSGICRVVSHSTNFQETTTTVSTTGLAISAEA